MNKQVVWAAVVLALTSSSVMATDIPGYIKGTKLNELCVQQNKLFIGGYVAGVLDDMYIQNFIAGTKTEICMPNNLSVADYVDIVCKRLEDKPQDRQFGGAWITFLAMKDAFPCSN